MHKHSGKPAISSVTPIASTLDYFLEHLHFQDGAMIARYGDYLLNSAFQPIFSFAHQRSVGLEALVRPSSGAGEAIPPPLFFGDFTELDDIIFVDRLCRALHVANFQSLKSQNWLFLNVNPLVVAQGKTRDGFFRQMLENYALGEHQIVIEILETAVHGETSLEETVEHYREYGCLVALDDFGAGYSNFERVWRLKPDIIKLDRSMIADSVRHRVIRRCLPNLVSLLHEAGCIVLAEGIETEEEASIALDAGVDLAQGYLFARPFAINNKEGVDLVGLERVQERSRQNFMGYSRRRREKISRYIETLEIIVESILRGAEVAIAAESLLKLPYALRFYMLNDRGDQDHHSIECHKLRQTLDTRLAPLTKTKGASWHHRSYFRKAVDRPGEIHITGPYLSLPDARMCITLSIALEFQGALNILCFDIDNDVETNDTDWTSFSK